MRQWVWPGIILAVLSTGFAAGYFVNPGAVPPVRLVVAPP